MKVGGDGGATSPLPSVGALSPPSVYCGDSGSGSSGNGEDGSGGGSLDGGKGAFDSAAESVAVGDAGVCSLCFFVFASIAPSSGVVANS